MDGGRHGSFTFVLLKPIHRLVKFIHVGVLDRQFLSQRRGVPQRGAGRLRATVQQTLGNHRQSQVALSRSSGRNDRVKSDLANRPKDRLDVAVGYGSFDGDPWACSDSECWAWGLTYRLSMTPSSAPNTNTPPPEYRQAAKGQERKRATLAHGAPCCIMPSWIRPDGVKWISCGGCSI